MNKHRHKFDDPKFAEATKHLEKAYALSREHNSVQTEAKHKYGEKGPWISGIGQQHWPEAIRFKLRKLCDDMNWHSKRADECRPARVRSSTMRALRDYIRSRDGTGFYL